MFVLLCVMASRLEIELYEIDWYRRVFGVDIMVGHVKVGQYRAALQREVAKLARQEEAILATTAMIELCESQIAALEAKK